MFYIEILLSKKTEKELDDYFLSNIHNCDEVTNVLNGYNRKKFLIKQKKGKKLYEFVNIACAFDIEVTSIKKNGNKIAFMYIWQFMIDGHIFIGRTWDEFRIFLYNLKLFFGLNQHRILPIYVHNLSYEFQFMHRYLLEEFGHPDVFATKKRNPIKVNYSGIEFRDSLILSGYPLKNLHKDMSHKIFKKVGDLDYSLIRHSETKLTDSELLYCIYDVYVLSVYIYEKIITHKSVGKIPMTKTGYVREHIRKKSVYSDDKTVRQNFNNTLARLALNSKEYVISRSAFMGGFTHANPYKIGKTYEEVHSMDFTSSYPTQLIAKKYPMSQAIIPTSKIDLEKLKEFKKKGYGFIIILKCDHIESLYNFDYYIPFSKINQKISQNEVVCNGRIAECDNFEMSMTDIDLDIITDHYELINPSISFCLCYKMDYLPACIIECIIDLYENKTVLKDVDGKEEEYQILKGLLNSIYGAMVQKIDNDNIVYENCIWNSFKGNIEEQIDNYNGDHKRFRSYLWGVWCTAYSRQALWTGIDELKNDYIYSDTDSVKFVNLEKHAKYFDDYNKNIIEEINKSLDRAGIDKRRGIPKTIKGKEKPLGVWDYEGKYDRFKTLGAKRYMYEKDNKFSITVSGLGKKSGAEFLTKLKNELNLDPFDYFNNNMIIPSSYTGKMTHTYIDDEYEGNVVDNNGLQGRYQTKSSIHLSPCDFNMSMSSKLLDFISGLEEIMV